MILDFALIPPELTSARMYAGPGPGSMIAAAEAWQLLAAELRATAGGYRAVVTGLTSGPWLGPSSVAMASAVQPYLGWLTGTAALAEQTAGQARAAAAAFETAFAAMVPPPLIAANRSELAALQTTNLLGQNTAAIAALEAEYLQMWAQDAAGMYGYAGESAGATTLAAFAGPAPDAGPGPTAQTATAAAGNAPAQVSTVVPTALQALAAPAAATNPLQFLIETIQEFIGMQDLFSLVAMIQTVPRLILPANAAAISVLMALGLATKGVASKPVAAAAAPTPIIVNTTTPAASAAPGTAASEVTAGAGRAGVVGGLAVPPSWATNTPTIRLAASALQGGSTPQVAPGTLGAIAGAAGAGAALGGLAPRAIGGTVARVGRLTGDQEKQPDQLKRVLAELSCAPESVQHWHTDQSDLEGLLARLAKRPGIHAVHLAKGDAAKIISPEAPSGS